MKTHHTSLFLSNLFTLLLSTSLSQSEDDPYYTNCSTRISCGTTRDLGYPFWGEGRAGYCGHQGLELDCHEEDDKIYPVMRMGTLEYRVLDINTKTLPIIRMARTDLWEGTCLQNWTNSSINYTIFSNSAPTRNLTIFYNCSRLNYSVPFNFSCGSQIGYYADESLLRIKLPPPEELACSGKISVPILATALEELTDEKIKLEDALNQGFDLIYPPERKKCSVCESTGGECGSNLSSSEFLCLCSHGHYPDQCPVAAAKKGNGINLKGKLGIAAASVFATITITLVLVCLYLRRKKTKDASLLLSRNMSYDPSSHGAEFEKSNGIHLFSYQELEEATNKFDSSKELGDGGFGTVYYGKLKDGRVVAVKRLYENNFKRVEQFLNEVEILTRLRHKHLVSLYGCTSRHSRELLLVYEYVSNGTVADHLHGPRSKPGKLPWHTRMKIAVETATALSYLHASDIIHRDVKTNNILLDEHFCVKVADFGLSRLFPTDVTHVSTAPQGTPGYVDPDYHQCYQLTDKSDVYSFGVVLIELISSMPAVDIARHRHEINLANLAINKIQNKAVGELVDPGLGFGSDCRVRRMVEAVAELAFGCLQGEKDSRPSMAEAMECLNRIQSNESWDEVKVKVGEEVIVSDGVVLLKSTDTLSPDSTIMNWSTSNDTTPSASM